MFSQLKIGRPFFVFCIVIFLAAFAFADTIRLKDGSIIKGKIISFEGGKFTVLIDDGTRQRTFTYTASEVDSIVFESDPIPLSDPTRNSSTTKSTDGNTTIITVGQTKPTISAPPGPGPDKTKNDPPKMIISDKSSTSTNQNNSKSTPVNSKPITIKIPVLADNTANGWTNSGWVVRRGQKIKIIGSGRVSLGNGRFAGPAGITTLPDSNKLIKDKPTGGLIAVIGADNNEFIFIGDSFEFIASRDGDLFLGLNEGNLNDNSGSFEVTIEIDPNLGN